MLPPIATPTPSAVNAAPLTDATVLMNPLLPLIVPSTPPSNALANMLPRMTSPVTLRASGTPKSIADHASSAAVNPSHGESVRKAENVFMPAPIAA